MLEEYYIWKKIFEEDNEFKIRNLLNLVIMNDDAREYVYDQILKLKNNDNEIIKLEINIDKDLKNYPINHLAEKIVDDLIKKIY